jgi:hypothetical protein
MSTKRKVKTLRLTEQDIAIIEMLKQHYGVTSDNEVIRMALRSAQRELPTPITPHKERPFYPHG